MKRLIVWSAALLAVACGLTVVEAQERERERERVYPTEPVVRMPTKTIWMGDQLFDASPDEPGLPRSRTEGQLLDSNNVTGNQKFAGWEAGIVPVEFADDIPPSRRDQFMRVCNAGWGGAAYVNCIDRTSQNGYVHVTTAYVDTPGGSIDSCYSYIGQFRRQTRYEVHLGPGCWAGDRSIYHEQGHMFGFIHEQQRPDRDTYVFIDTSNIEPSEIAANFNRVNLGDPATGPYDFLSVMHYRQYAFAVDPSRPTIIARSPYTSFQNSMGTASAPSQYDKDAINHLYQNYFRYFTYTPLIPTTRFNRDDFLDAMERLHALYYSRLGLIRPEGLSLNGKPDFLGIATWIFDIYLGARSRGFGQDLSFNIVMTDVTRSDEWKAKHPGWTSGSRDPFTPIVNFSRAEFLNVLNQLDRFYAAPEGLQRPNGLSIYNGPDFLGIATWVFDVYLNERLGGGSPDLAWTRVVNAIRATDEWRRKH